jgi:Na+/H+ antiporter NhaD/arsenite permease-like protein
MITEIPNSYLETFNPSVYLSLAFLFGIAAQFRAMDGYSFLRRMLSSLDSKIGVVYAVALITTVFSPFILNDVLILILTPVLVKISRENAIGIAPLVVAEVTYTNISSALTPLGNPQNILLWEYSGLSAFRFVELTWRPLIVSLALTSIAVYPLTRHTGKKPINIDNEFNLRPAIYLFMVAALVFTLNLLKTPSVLSLAISFFLGFTFTARSLKTFRREFDVKSLLTLYLLITSVSVASIFLEGYLKPYVESAATGQQPYSAAFMLIVSNIISNVPATQLVLTVGNVPPTVAPKLAVEAGLAGNIDPIGSLANLLALNIMRQDGLPLRRTIMLQLLIGTISFLPAFIA